MTRHNGPIWPDDDPPANSSLDELEQFVAEFERGDLDGEDKSASTWPVLNPVALYGLAGDVVNTFAPHTEADPAAILFQTLTVCGSMIGRSVRCEVEQTAHYLNLFPLIVGETSKGRKGTSFQYPRRLCEKVDPAWSSNRITSGLSSAEGLLAEVQDGQDPACDKRLLIVQSEFASVLRVMERDGNNLSPLLRDAFDGGILRSMVKRNPQKATGAHISMIGHITRHELLRHLSDTEQHNGFANRLLWCCAKRSQYLPEGGKIDEGKTNALATRLSDVVRWAKTRRVIERDGKARELWCAIYKKLSEGQPGLLGAATSRAEAYVMRLSALYAVLNRSAVVRVEHLRAALAVWEYAFASARYIFGIATGDPVADRIREALKESEDGLSRTEISALFGRNESTERISQALTQLKALGIVDSKVVKSNGRPGEVWFTKKTN